jgi:hypothetical protein
LALFRLSDLAWASGQLQLPERRNQVVLDGALLRLHLAQLVVRPPRSSDELLLELGESQTGFSSFLPNACRRIERLQLKLELLGIALMPRRRLLTTAARRASRLYVTLYFSQTARLRIAALLRSSRTSR